ncbi:MAG: hypothetical protein HY360_25560 [Verrucomicrobia bacterium]|nr:hypothetical protein [Verrucomicrobiota bacterium]
MLLAEAAPWMRGPARGHLTRVLNQVDLPHLVWMIDPDGNQVQPVHRHWLDSLTAKGIAPWLAAYWAGRRLGLVESPR